MRTSTKGKLAIASREGISLTKYKDSVGVYTIGIGCTATEVHDIDTWPMNRAITIAQACGMFTVALGRYEDALNKYLTRPILQHQFDALVSWCYNVGVGWVEHATIVKLLNAGETDKTKLWNALMMYDHPPEIIPRRRNEAALLTTGAYGDGKISLFPVSDIGRPLYAKAKIVDLSAYLGAPILAETPSALDWVLWLKKKLFP